MPATRITSTKNKIVGRFQDAASGRIPGAMVADGVTLVEEAIRAGLDVQDLLASPRLVSSERGRALRRLIMGKGVRNTDCSDEVMARISHLTSHQGVAAIVARPQPDTDTLLGPDALVVIAAGIRDPGNLGAVLRTAEAAGATGVIALAGGADPFRDKAVRASSGSVFRLPVLARPAAEEVLEQLAGTTRIVVAESDAETDYLDADLGGPTALVLGGETGGVPEVLLAAAAQRVRVPMRGAVDSLNVAVTAGVLLYEARRQRR